MSKQKFNYSFFIYLALKTNFCAMEAVDTVAYMYLLNLLNVAVRVRFGGEYMYIHMYLCVCVWLKFQCTFFKSFVSSAYSSGHQSLVARCVCG